MHLHHLTLRRPLRDLHRGHTIAWQSAQGDKHLWALPLPGLMVIATEAPTLHKDRDVASIHTTPYNLDHARGDTVGFSLIACPTRMTGATRKRHTLPAEEQVPWLERKTADALTLTHVHRDHLGPRRAKHGATHVWVQFSGTATVKDPDALRALAREGIGTGKAHGAGLLLVGAR